MPRPPFSRATRRARLRTSVGVSAGVSSINNGTSLSLVTARFSLGQSSCSSLPLRTRVWSMRPIEDSIRIISESAGISILNTRMGNFCVSTACSTRFIAKLVLPIEGRPATITRSESCKPEVILSSSAKPVLRPVISPPDWNSSSIRPRAACSSGLISCGPPDLGPSSEICIIRRSARSSNSSDLRPSGLNPLSAMSCAASISLRKLARSRTTCA